MIAELYDAVDMASRHCIVDAVHCGRWAKATHEVSLTVLESARAASVRCACSS